MKVTVTMTLMSLVSDPTPFFVSSDQYSPLPHRALLYNMLYSFKNILDFNKW